ncbi:MAG: PRC-barrel domain-containing protein [Candidatus Micrarchaeota archaeon]|nr:PRC-barrel domain-containing protein [Candidatus Micrarchaeota archaeon]
MSKFAIARQLAGKRLITNDGEEIGKLVDAIINEVSGKMESLVVEPNPDNLTARKMKKEDGMLLVPYNSVMAVSDHVIIDKKGI